jgi:translation initiation factor 1
MADRNGARIVYSSDAGRVCPKCGWPIRECRCSRKSAGEPVPARVVAKLRIVKELCQDLKRTCGTGGAVVDGTVQLQGDLRDRIRAVLLDKGIVVKG